MSDEAIKKTVTVRGDGKTFVPLAGPVCEGGIGLLCGMIRCDGDVWRPVSTRDLGAFLIFGSTIGMRSVQLGVDESGRPVAYFFTKGYVPDQTVEFNLRWVGPERIVETGGGVTQEETDAILSAALQRKLGGGEEGDKAK